MTSYKVKKQTPLECHEGDNTEFTIIVPPILNMNGRTVKMQVRSSNGDLIFSKETGTGIVQNEQSITIKIDPDDTKTMSGSHLWEMEVINQDDGIITIASGTFTIRKETCR